MRILSVAVCVFLAGVAAFGATRLQADLCLLEGRSGVALLLAGTVPTRSGIDRVFATHACARDGGRRAEAAKELGLVHLSLLQGERKRSADERTSRGRASARLAAAAFADHLAMHPANAAAWVGLAHAQAVLGESAASLQSLGAADVLAPQMRELAAHREQTLALIEPPGVSPRDAPTPVR